jgi:hypothetical protein
MVDIMQAISVTITIHQVKKLRTINAPETRRCNLVNHGAVQLGAQVLVAQILRELWCVKVLAVGDKPLAEVEDKARHLIPLQSRAGVVRAKARDGKMVCPAMFASPKH